VHIVVFEPNPSGHRFTHVRRLVPALAALGQHLTFVTSREGLESEEYEAQIRAVAHLCEVEASMRLDPNALFLGRFQSFAAELHRVATDLGADHVIMPYADGTIQVAGLRRLTGRFRLPKGVELEGLLMRGSFAYSAPSLQETVRSKAWLTLTTAAPFRVLHHLDPIVIRELAKRAPTLFRRVHLMPDPADPINLLPRIDARRRLGIAEDGRYIGCVGSMDRRKGIDLLIRAFLAAPVAPADRLLLAGRHEPEIRTLLAGEAADDVRRGRIVSLDRYLGDDDLQRGIAAMDVVCTPYPPDRSHSGSSSIAIHAAGQERSVLGSDMGWIGETIRRFGLGNVCNVADPAAFAQAISRSLDAADDFHLSDIGRRFVAFHRTENFAACFTRRLRERLGLPIDTSLPTWDWVLNAS
jgi:glycosyltransferase involved in cell wall biosynthesis